MASHELRLRRVLAAPRHDVFRAWTDPDELKRWWGPGAFTTPYAEIDLRPGGQYLLVMQPPSGEALRLAGTFRVVEPPELLVYTWRWESGVPDPTESLVTVEFIDLGGRTELILTHAGFPPEGDSTPYLEGWESGLDKLGALFRSRTEDIYDATRH